jgi:hypothetical protein
MAAKSLTTEEVLDRAQRWARMHKIEKYRSKMDDLLAGLSEEDQRRVYLCGQRISGGLPPKVIPASTNGKEEGHAKEKRKQHKPEPRQPNASAGKGAAPVKSGKAVGASGGTKSKDTSRRNSSKKKR